jgi:hypothetical protein
VYINRSQRHECENWDCGREIPFGNIGFEFSVLLLCSAVLGNRSSFVSPISEVLIILLFARLQATLIKFKCNGNRQLGDLKFTINGNKTKRVSEANFS